jgi:hypothetical protein
MEQEEMREEATTPASGPEGSPVASSAAPLTARADPADMRAPAAESCPTCGAATAGGPVPSFVYAIGRVEARFPHLSLEKELAQVIGRSDAAGQTDREALHAALSQPENRYVARQMCWVLSIQALETYILQPRDPNDLHLLVDALRASPTPADVDVVIGVKGPLASPEMCNGLIVPIIAFDQMYSFDRSALINAIPKPEKIAAKDFTPAAEELFDRIMLITDNAGATDEHRALNYLAVRYPRIYEAAAEAFANNESLTAVDVRPSPLSGTRKVLDVIFSFTHRGTDVVTKYGTRVDLTEEFPFLVSKLGPWYDR